MACHLMSICERIVSVVSIACGWTNTHLFCDPGPHQVEPDACDVNATSGVGEGHVDDVDDVDDF